jgi:hypothetical protein
MADVELGELVGQIIQGQNQQITFMRRWLLEHGYPLHAPVACVGRDAEYGYEE